MNSDLTEKDPGEDTPERAFTDSGTFTFAGMQLRPFSQIRQEAALAMGLRWGRLTQDEIRWNRNARKDLLPELREELKRAPKKDKGKFAEKISQIESEPAEILDYDRFLKDVSIVLWICSPDVADSKALKVERRPDEFQAERGRWADKHGLGINGPKSEEAASLMVQIVDGSNRSRGVPELPESEDNDDDSGNV